MRPTGPRLLGVALAAVTLGSVSCGPSAVIEVAPALIVVDTFPGHGVLLPGASVTHIDVVYSELVDAELALAKLKLEAVDGADTVLNRYGLSANVEHGEHGYDAKLLTLSVLIDTPDGALPDDTRFVIRVERGLTSRSGSVLAVDFVRRFATQAP